MTVIAWKDGIIAADRMRVDYDRIFDGINKLTQLDGVVFTITGDCSYLQPCIDWYKSNFNDGKNMPLKLYDVENTDFIVFYSNVFKIYSRNMPFGVIVKLDKPKAFGRGDEMAIGAMRAGFTAIQAVKLCNEEFTTCGGGFDTLLTTNLKACDND